MRNLLALILMLLVSSAYAQVAPDGSVLPSERRPGEALGCGTGRNCFWMLPMSAPEIQALTHALWANDERRDDFMRGMRARILKTGGFAIYDATPAGWKQRDEMAYSLSLPEVNFVGLALMNAHHTNRAQDEASEQEIAAADYLRFGGTRQVRWLFRKFQDILRGDQ